MLNRLSNLPRPVRIALIVGFVIADIAVIALIISLVTSPSPAATPPPPSTSTATYPAGQSTPQPGQTQAPEGIPQPGETQPPSEQGGTVPPNEPPQEPVCVPNGICEENETDACVDCIGPNESLASACGVPCPTGQCPGELSCSADGICTDEAICEGVEPYGYGSGLIPDRFTQAHQERALTRNNALPLIAGFFTLNAAAAFVFLRWKS